MSIRRTAAACAVVLGLGALSLSAGPSPAHADPLPPTAVAMGDSFISGEGAGSYSAVVDQSGASQGFPGWAADNRNAYFCHRSPNASISVADLPGVTDRVNLACSGAQPADMANPSSAREGGRTVASQIDQLREVAATHDIDLVLIGLGSNNSHFTFGAVAAECAGRFVGDGYTGWWEVWIHLINWITGQELNENPCTDADLAGPEQFAGAQADTDRRAAPGARRARRGRRRRTAPGRAPGLHQPAAGGVRRAVPHRVRPRRRAGQVPRPRRRAVRRRLPGRRRQPRPCAPVLPGAGHPGGRRRRHAARERPGADITYLNVQHAFDGARLCENPGSPGNALPTPLRVMDGPTGVFVESFTPFDKLDIKRVTDTCSDYYQTCQESWHPSAAGHQVLGQCLTGAWTQGGALLTCTRTPSGAIQVQ